jgi:hypothetical protein
MNECVNRLVARPPRSKREAITLFDYFSSRLSEVGPNHIAKLQNARIVPVLSESMPENGQLVDKKTISQPDPRHVTPQQCYLGTSDTYSEIFDFVDFGRDANAFLMKCGSKEQPTKPQLVALACKEPARLLGVMKSSDKYTAMLKDFAESFHELKKDKELLKQMKTARWLGGSLDIPAEKEKKSSKGFGEDGNLSDDELEDKSIKQYKLVTPSEVVVVSCIYQGPGIGLRGLDVSRSMEH